MENKIEINAINREKAVERAIKILEVTKEQVVRVTEKQKPKSLFGFFAKDGIYEIEVNRDMKPQETKSQEIKSDVIDKAKFQSKKEVKREPKQEKKEIKKEVKKDTKKESIQKSTSTEKTDKPTRKEPNPEKEKEIMELAQSLLDKMGLDLTVEKIKLNGRDCIINLSGEDNGIVIGKKGKTLNSYEYLLNTLIKDARIDVDVEGFKAKRNVTLRDLAKKMSEKALSTNRPVKLNPMPPKERKIIHEVVNKYPQLDTYSEGRDPKRYIVIKKKRQG